MQSIDLDYGRPSDGTPCLVSGWGESGTGISAVLQWIKLDVSSDSSCSEAYPDLYDPSIMICTSTPVRT